MGLLLNSLVLYITVLLLKIVNADRPLVKTELGQLEGVWQLSENGLKYAAFMGIPYAKPPVGDLRFEPPKNIKPWTGVLDAGDYRSHCKAYERNLLEDDTVSGEEDCLYLNIFTPSISQNATCNKLLDVIFYIHEGSFMSGQSNFYGAKYLMDRNVILVTINYRVGPLGFLSFEDEILPGNNGLRDQRMALKWVQQHISKFGGNPKSVTLMGHGAGGASVHYHLLAPYEKSLFKNAISMSGSATCPWALVDNPREQAMKLATSIGCNFDNGTQNIVDCLKGKPASVILLSVAVLYVATVSPYSPLGPVIEHTPSPKYLPFIPKAPLELMKCGKQRRVPWMVGIMESEGLFPVASFIANTQFLNELNEIFEFLVPQLLDFKYTVNGTDVSRVTRKIRKEYFRSKNVSTETAMQLVKMVSDRLYVLDIQNSADIQRKFAPVYFYRISRKPAFSVSDVLSNTTNDYGASHADDLTYLFNITYFPDGERNKNEKKFMEMMLDLWTSFATSRKSIPKSKGVCWERLNSHCDFNYLNLDGAIPAKMAVENDFGNYKFWTSLPINEGTQRKHNLKKGRFYNKARYYY